MLDRGKQSQHAGDNSVLIQAGRDVALSVDKAPPNIKLISLTVDDDTDEDGLKQRLSIIIKNNGDTTAVLMRGDILVEAKETVTNCNRPRYPLIKTDWTYDVDLGADLPDFAGRHAVAPNEVVSFDVSIGRKAGGPEITIYRCRLHLTFDEGDRLETGHFFLRLAGPMVPQGMATGGITEEMWAWCMADNIRRLDAIGYDYRTHIDPGSRKCIVDVAPDLFS